MEIEDHWEKFIANFTVFYPQQDPNENLQIIGDKPSLGEWTPQSPQKVPTTAMINLNKPIPKNGEMKKMTKVERKQNWLLEKYGQGVRPWQFSVLMENKNWQEALHLGFNKTTYSYVLKNDFAVTLDNQEVWEREPFRQMEIQDAKLYRGELS